MNYFKALALIFSFRREFYYVLITFLCILLLPFIVIILLTHTGIDIVSDKLAKFDKNTKTIQLYYPTGQSYKTIHADVTWPTTGVITLEFGQSDLPYQIMHSGIDIANPNGKIGDPITPMMQGKVIYAGDTGEEITGTKDDVFVRSQVNHNLYKSYEHQYEDACDKIDQALQETFKGNS